MAANQRGTKQEVDLPILAFGVLGGKLESNCQYLVVSILIVNG